MTAIRPAAVAGTWYPGSARDLADAVDRYLARAEESEATGHESAARRSWPSVVALIAPHAGLIYSGPVAAHAYGRLRARAPEIAVLVGPSHFVAFDGVAVYRGAGFETPLGLAEIDRECAAALVAASPLIHEHPEAHRREHSLEMQLPFLRRVAPDARIVPLLMGLQTPSTMVELGDALAIAVRGRNAVLIASTDLSHYRSAAVAAEMDAVVLDHVEQFDADGLQRALAREPHHACGGGPTVAVMRAARRLGADEAVVLKYADSGDVSGDKSAVVGYMAAVLGARAPQLQPDAAEGARST